MRFCYRLLPVRRRAAMESMMTARQVAELLGVHENWVYDQAAAGQLPSYKIGGARRFDPAELRAWLAEHREGASSRMVDPRASRRRIPARSSGRRGSVDPTPEPPKPPLEQNRASAGDVQPSLFAA